MVTLQWKTKKTWSAFRFYSATVTFLKFNTSQNAYEINSKMLCSVNFMINVLTPKLQWQIVRPYLHFFKIIYLYSIFLILNHISTVPCPRMPKCVHNVCSQVHGLCPARFDFSTGSKGKKIVNSPRRRECSSARVVKFYGPREN